VVFSRGVGIIARETDGVLKTPNAVRPARGTTTVAVPVSAAKLARAKNNNNNGGVGGGDDDDGKKI
jgi:hypothetical protein